MNDSANTKTNISKKWKYLLLAVMFLPVLAVEIELNDDIWFLLNGGRFVMQNGIPFTDPFTVHEGLDFVMQQWLTNIIFWNIYRFLGEAGIYVVIIASFCLMLFITYRACMLVSEGNFFTSFAVTLCCGVIGSIFVTSRPQVFSTLIFVAELYLLELYYRRGKPSYLLPLPVLSALLINLQAAMWPMLFVLALPFAAESLNLKIKFIKSEPCRRLPPAISLAASFAAGFINPYGTKAMTYLFRSYGVSYINELVGEMHAPDMTENLGKIFFALLFVMVCVLVIKKGGSTRLRYLLLGLGTLLLSLTAYRNIFIFVFCAVYPYAFLLKASFAGADFSTDGSSPALRSILACLMAVMMAGGAAYKCVSIATADTRMFNADAIDFLIENYDVGEMRLYTGYSGGTYAEFKGIKVYMDARAELFLKANNHRKDILIEYFMMQRGTIYYRDVIDRYNFTHLYASTGDILYTYLEHDKDFKLIYQDSDGRIFVPVNN